MGLESSSRVCKGSGSVRGGQEKRMVEDERAATMVTDQRGCS